MRKALRTDYPVSLWNNECNKDQATISASLLTAAERIQLCASLIQKSSYKHSHSKTWISAPHFLGCKPRETEADPYLCFCTLCKDSACCVRGESMVPPLYSRNVRHALSAHQGDRGDTVPFWKHNGKESWLHTILKKRKQSLGLISPSACKFF